MIPLKDDNPTRTFPFVTIIIITVNTFIYVYQLTLGPRAEGLFVLRAGAIPYEITHFLDIYPKAILLPPLTLFTAMFVHGGFLPLARKMVSLWIFGYNIESQIGH